MMDEQKCAFCGDPFTPNRNGKQVYCSTDCRYRQAMQRSWERKQAEKAAALNPAPAAQ